MDEQMKKDFKRYGKAAVASAVLAAGLGSVIRRRRAEKAREKALDPETGRSAVVVQVSKKNFLRDLPTPDQYESSVVQTQAASNVLPKLESPEAVAAAKKDILRSRPRTIDFFRKAAKDESDADGSAKKEKADEPNASAGKEKEETGLPRNALGQFVSPTDPMGVVEADNGTEKKAYTLKQVLDSAGNTVLHPIETVGGMWSALPKPIPMIAGGVGSMYLAALIVDAVNKRRAANSKDNVDEARNEYVRLMQEANAEKTAEAKSGYRTDDNLVAGATALGAASFMVPAVLTAIVVNKVLERRKEAKKKAQSGANSFPDEPYILYKTSEAKEERISPETALAMIFIKEGMMMEADGAENMSKEAQFEWLGNMWEKAKDLGARGVEGVSGAIDKAREGIGGELSRFEGLAKLKGKIKDGKFTDEGIRLLGSDEMDEPLYNMASAYINGQASPAMGIAGGALGRDALKSLVADKRVYDLFVKKFGSGDERWKKLQDAAVNKGLERFGTQNSILRQILAWLYKNTPLGGYMFRQGLRKKMGIPAQQ